MKRRDCCLFGICAIIVTYYCQPVIAITLNEIGSNKFGFGPPAGGIGTGANAASSGGILDYGGALYSIACFNVMNLLPYPVQLINDANSVDGCLLNRNTANVWDADTTISKPVVGISCIDKNYVKCKLKYKIVLPDKSSKGGKKNCFFSLDYRGDHNNTTPGDGDYYVNPQWILESYYSPISLLLRKYYDSSRDKTLSIQTDVYGWDIASIESSTSGGEIICQLSKSGDKMLKPFPYGFIKSSIFNNMNTNKKTDWKHIAASLGGFSKHWYAYCNIEGADGSIVTKELFNNSSTHAVIIDDKIVVVIRTVFINGISKKMAGYLGIPDDKTEAASLANIIVFENSKEGWLKYYLSFTDDVASLLVEKELLILGTNDGRILYNDGMPGGVLSEIRLGVNSAVKGLYRNNSDTVIASLDNGSSYLLKRGSYSRPYKILDSGMGLITSVCQYPDSNGLRYSIIAGSSGSIGIINNLSAIPHVLTQMDCVCEKKSLVMSMSPCVYNDHDMMFIKAHGELGIYDIKDAIKEKMSPLYFDDISSMIVAPFGFLLIRDYKGTTRIFNRVTCELDELGSGAYTDWSTLIDDGRNYYLAGIDRNLNIRIIKVTRSGALSNYSSIQCHDINTKISKICVYKEWLFIGYSNGEVKAFNTTKNKLTDNVIEDPPQVPVVDIYVDKDKEIYARYVNGKIFSTGINEL